MPAQRERRYISDATSTVGKRTSDSHLSSLSPVKRLLYESTDSNIEIIQMDEQECLLEIVDGVLTIVPKDHSPSSDAPSRKLADESTKKSKNNYGKRSPMHVHERQTSRRLLLALLEPSKHQPRSSSVASSLSSPSLSEPEQERDELSSRSSSRLSSKARAHVIPTSKPPVRSPPASCDVLDLFSEPLLATPPSTKKVKKPNLLDESLSSVSSYGDNSSETKKPPSIPRSSSPIHRKESKPSASIKGKSFERIERVRLARICEPR